MEILVQITVISCFAIVIIALFREKTDFLFFSIAAMLIAAASTYFLSPGTVYMSMGHGKKHLSELNDLKINLTLINSNFLKAVKRILKNFK